MNNKSVFNVQPELYIHDLCMSAAAFTHYLPFKKNQRILSFSRGIAMA